MDTTLWSLEPEASMLMHGDIGSDSLQDILDLLGDCDGSETLIEGISCTDASFEAWSPLDVPAKSSQLAIAPRPSQLQSVGVTASSEKKRYKESGSTRVRNELIVVRAQAKELEDQLELVRSRRSSTKSSIAASSSPSCEGKLRGQKISIWRSVAHRQHRARREAEEMNQRLRETLEQQRKITQQFLRSLKRGSTMLESRPDQQAPPVDSPIKTTKHIHDIVDYDEMVEASLCQTLLNKVDLLMIQANDVFSHVEFKSNNPISQQTTYGAEGMVSVVDSRVVPFDCAATSDAIWKYYSDRTTEPTSPPFKAENDVDLMIKGFRMTLGAGFQIGRVQGMIVGRRFVEQGRVTIVWAADMTPSLDLLGGGFLSAKVSNHLSFRAHGWTCVSQNDTMSTKIQMKHCVSPNSSSRGEGLGIMAQMVTKLVAQGLCEHHETIHRRVDDTFVTAKAEKSSVWSASTSLSSLFSCAPCVTLESW